MSNIVTRLRNPPFGTETSERNLMSAAADAIEAQWKPIADAPEHTSIILCCWWVGLEKAYPFVCEGYLDWDGKTWRRANDVAWDETKYTLPTHWQPLPTPPNPTPATRATTSCQPAADDAT